MMNRSITMNVTSSSIFIRNNAQQHHQKLRGIRSIFNSALATNNLLKRRLHHHWQLPSSSFHRSFSDAPKPFSRKRSSSSESTINSAIPNHTFNQHAIVAILHIYRSINPLLELNDGFHWSCSQLKIIQQIAAKYPGTLTDMTLLDPLVLADDAVTLCLNAGSKGSYIFTVDRQLERINVQSPISGTYSYTYNEEHGWWYSVIDNHDMRGLITRDLLRHCRGCPMF